MEIERHLKFHKRKRESAENWLRESDARFRSIFANAAVGVVLIDNDGQLLMANNAFCNFLGFPRQEVIYKTLGQFVLLEGNNLETILDKNLATGQTCMLEQQFVRKDGEVVWGRLNIAPVKDEQETYRTRVLVCEDVTALKIRESELLAQGLVYEAMHGALREIFKTSAQLIAAPYPELANAPQGCPPYGEGRGGATDTGYEEAVADRVIVIAREITGAKWVDYYSYDADSRTLCLTSSTARPRDLVVQAQKQLQYGLDDEQGLVSLVARRRKPLYVPDVRRNSGWMILEPGTKSCYLEPVCYRENLFGVYVLLPRQENGFSGQQRAMADTLALSISSAMENTRLFEKVQRAFEQINGIQQQLLRSQKMEAIGQLAGGIAHDLNNQLTVIQASLDLMGLAPEQGAFCKSCYRIRMATEKSANLVRQLLLFGRKHPQFKVLFDLNANVRELKEVLERLIGEHVAICLDLAPELQMVYADATNIEQVVINMAINSRDAMPDGGMIAIKTENVAFDQITAPPGHPPGHFVCLSVSDTGTGIAEQDQQHIFEPFFTTKELGKGSGLGLSVAYGIVEAHGGWINVESIPGAGSTFKVYLPVSDAGCRMPDAGDELIASCLQGNGEHLLAVENDPGDRKRSCAQRHSVNFGEAGAL
jgi:PAS domain S-box-containing protein